MRERWWSEDETRRENEFFRLQQCSEYTESEAEERGALVADGEYEATLCRISSDLKVTVLSEPDVGAAVASYIRPGNFFIAIARIVNTVVLTLNFQMQRAT